MLRSIAKQMLITFVLMNLVLQLKGLVSLRTLSVYGQWIGS